jgi:hypothetical protein
VLEREMVWSGLLLLLLLLVTLVAREGGWAVRGEVGVANEYLRVPNWDAWEVDRAPRMACLVESVIVETGKVP